MSMTILIILLCVRSYADHGRFMKFFCYVLTVGTNYSNFGSVIMTLNTEYNSTPPL